MEKLRKRKKERLCELLYVQLFSQTKKIKANCKCFHISSIWAANQITCIILKKQTKMQVL